jgi:hypothetical protein
MQLIGCLLQGFLVQYHWFILAQRDSFLPSKPLGCSNRVVGELRPLLKRGQVSLFLQLLVVIQDVLPDFESPIIARLVR